MAGAARQKAAQRAKPDPFLTLPAAAILSAAWQADGLALKLLMLLHAAWTPFANGGGAILPTSEAVRITGAGRTQVAKAFYQLQQLQMVRLVRPGTRPMGAGGSLGLAAVWGLPLRKKDEAHPAGLFIVPEGHRRPEGRVRLNAGRVRHDAEKLSVGAFRTLMAIIAYADRDKFGQLVRDEPFSLGPQLVSSLTGLPPRSASRAIAELLEKGRVVVVSRAAGRRPAQVQLLLAYRTFERSAPRPGDAPLPSGFFKASRSGAKTAPKQHSNQSRFGAQ